MHTLAVYVLVHEVIIVKSRQSHLIGSLAVVELKVDLEDVRGESLISLGILRKSLLLSCHFIKSAGKRE